MRKAIIITILIIFTITAFAQSMDWWVADNGGGMQVFGSDTIWASIGQTAIGEKNAGTTYLGAGYLYSDNEALEILEIKKDTKRPYTFGINSVSPNPFNPTCAICFEIEEDSEIDFEIFNILGERVDTPLRDIPMQPGLYRITWNGGTNPSGTYFARLSSCNKTVTQRVVYLK